jgi:hypothetical protein
MLWGTRSPFSGHFKAFRDCRLRKREESYQGARMLKASHRPGNNQPLLIELKDIWQLI